jgi:hypothetical protein
MSLALQVDDGSSFHCNTTAQQSTAHPARTRQIVRHLRQLWCQLRRTLGPHKLHPTDRTGVQAAPQQPRRAPQQRLQRRLHGRAAGEDVCGDGEGGGGAGVG